MLKDYYYLTKPGIVRGNLITAAAGYLFASKDYDNFSLVSLILSLVGIILVISSGCVFNNVLDRKIDNKMTRTKSRSVASGKISPQNALIFAVILGMLGFWALFKFTNPITVIIGIVGIIAYVLLYGIVKRKSHFATEVGTISGATPILAGYTAANGSIDLAGLLLFIIMLVWQIPHFYAISIFRMKEYKKANIPVLSVVKGIPAVKKRILVYIAIYIVISFIPTLLGFTGIFYGVSILTIGLYWLVISSRGYSESDDILWARKSFGASLTVLMIFSIMLSLDAFLP